MKIIYVRCLDCCFIFNKDLKKCPNCKKEQSINENSTNEQVFNLND